MKRNDLYNLVYRRCRMCERLVAIYRDPVLGLRKGNRYICIECSGDALYG